MRRPGEAGGGVDRRKLGLLGCLSCILRLRAGSRFGEAGEFGDLLSTPEGFAWRKGRSALGVRELAGAA